MQALSARGVSAPSVCSASTRRCTPAAASTAASRPAHGRAPVTQLHTVVAGSPLVAAPSAVRVQRAGSSVCSSTQGAVTTEDDVVRVASVGDLVSVHFTCRGQDGEVLESSYEVNEPLCFEVGAGDMMGNKLFQGFDEAVRGLAVGQKTLLEASGGEWNKDLMFMVPTDHPEVQRLQGRYKNHGGLHRGLIVELANNAMAMVVDVTEKGVQLDANNMLAGKLLTFELEVLDIELATDAAARTAAEAAAAAAELEA